MKGRLWVVLVIPLALVSAAALTIHFFWDWDGLLVNVATEVLGIIITVSYVDWIIQRHERERWTGTKQRLSRIINVFVNGTITGLRGAFRIHFRELDTYLGYQVDHGVVDVAGTESQLDRFSSEHLEPNLRRYVDGLDKAGWSAFMSHVQSTAGQAQLVLDRFAWQLSPRQIELLLDIQAAAQSAQFMWFVFPEFAGAPLDELPQTSTPPEELQEYGYDLAASETAKILALARQLRDA